MRLSFWGSLSCYKKKSSPKWQISVRLQQVFHQVFFVCILLHSFTHLHNLSRACSREASPQHDGAFFRLYCGDFVYLLKLQHALNKLGQQHVSIRPSRRARVFKPVLNGRTWGKEKNACWETAKHTHGDNSAHFWTVSPRGFHGVPLGYTHKKCSCVKRDRGSCPVWNQKPTVIVKLIEFYGP